MGRIRTVKPELFKHEELFDAESEEKMPLRLCFIGLFTACDREGRFKWKPRSLKSDIMPYDDIDFSRVLDALATRRFIVKYVSSSGDAYGYIPSFTAHQVINHRERDSVIPPPPDPTAEGNKPLETRQELTRQPRVNHASTTWALQCPRGNKEQGTRNKEQGTSTDRVVVVDKEEEEKKQNATLQTPPKTKIPPPSFHVLMDSVGDIITEFDLDYERVKSTAFRLIDYGQQKLWNANMYPFEFRKWLTQDIEKLKKENMNGTANHHTARNSITANLERLADQRASRGVDPKTLLDEVEDDISFGEFGSTG